MNGTPYNVELEKSVVTSKTPKLIRPERILDETPRETKVGTGLSKILAPLPGTIIKINVKEGDVVLQSDLLIEIE